MEADVLGGTRTLPVSAGHAASHQHLVVDESRESGSSRVFKQVQVRGTVVAGLCDTAVPGRRGPELLKYGWSQLRCA